MNKPINIILYFAVYRREAITRIFIEGVKRLMAYKPSVYKITPVAVVSEAADGRLMKEAGFDYFSFENKPLGRKKNAGLNYILKNYEFDYIMETGSDDLIHNRLLDFYLPYFESGEIFFNPDGVSFYNMLDGRISKCEGHRIIGAGRCFHRSVFHSAPFVCLKFIKSCSGVHGAFRRGLTVSLPGKIAQGYINAEMAIEIEQPYGLWPDEKNSGLDTGSTNKLFLAGIVNKTITIPDKRWIIDLKSSQNISNFEAFPVWNVKKSWLFLNYSKKEKELINKTYGQC